MRMYVLYFEGRLHLKESKSWTEKGSSSRSSNRSEEGERKDGNHLDIYSCC